MFLTFWHPISTAQSISRSSESMSTVAIFQNLAQRCRHVARGSYSRRLLTGLDWNRAALGGGLFNEASRDSKEFRALSV